METHDEKTCCAEKCDRGLTLRAFLLGAGAIALISLLLQKVTLGLGGPDLNEWAPPTGPVVLLGVLVLLLVALRGMLPWLRLSRGELVVIYCMAYVGSVLSGTGLVHRLLPGMVTIHFMYADPGTWYASFLKYIPAWFGPLDTSPDAVNEFFAATGAGVPWEAWLLPLAAWSVLICSLFFAMLCVVILLLRQWTETENLSFPIVQLPLALIGEKASDDKLGGLLKQRLMWIGFAISALLFGYNGLTNYVTALTPVGLQLDFGNFLVEKPWSVMARQASLEPFVFSVSPVMIGIAYLFPLNTLFSVWLFYLITRLQLLGTEIVGLSNVMETSQTVRAAGHRSFPFLSSQARGGVYVLIILVLWSARSHLKEVFVKALRRRRDLPDRGTEPFSARFTLWSLVGTLVICVCWAHMAGLGIGYGAVFFVMFLLLALAFARMRAEAGVPFSEAATVPIIILPVYQMGGEAILWEDGNPWREAWRRLEIKNELVNLIIPIGQLADVMAITPEQALRGDREPLRKFALSYGAEETLVAVAKMSPTEPSSVDVTIQDFGTGVGVVKIERFEISEGETIPELLQRAVVLMAERLEHDWKVSNLLSFDQEVSLQVVVPIDDWPQWRNLITKLRQISIIQNVAIAELSSQEAILQITFLGEMERLVVLLLRHDINLERVDNNWLLSFVAGPITNAGSDIDRNDPLEELPELLSNPTNREAVPARVPPAVDNQEDLFIE